MADQTIYIPVILRQLNPKGSVGPTDIIGISDANGNILFKCSIQQLVQNSGVSFSGGVAGIAKTDSTPAAGATPESQVIYIAGPGTYANFPGADSNPIVLTENLNLISWDGTKASVQEVPVDVDTSNLIPKTDITNDPAASDPNKVLGAAVLPSIYKDSDADRATTNQLFDKNNIRQDIAIGSVGNEVAAAGAETTLYISIPDGKTKLSWSGLLNTGFTHKISFYKEDGTFISNSTLYQSATSGTVDIPALSGKFNFYYKNPADLSSKETLMLNWGESPLPYESFIGDIIGFKGTPIKNADKDLLEVGQAYKTAETYNKTEINNLIPSFQKSDISGNNQFDIDTMVKEDVNVSSVSDYGITNVSGWGIAMIKLKPGQTKIAITGWASTRTEIEIGTVPVPPTFTTPFNSGLLKSGNATHMGFVKSGGATVLDITDIVAGVTGDVYMFMTINSNAELPSVYQNLMVADSDVPMDFEPYLLESIVTDVNEDKIAASYLQNNAGKLITVDNIATTDQIKLKFKEINFDGALVRVRTNYDADYDLVQTISLNGSNNGASNVLATYRIGKSDPITDTTLLVSINGDMTPPIQGPNSIIAPNGQYGFNNLGGNHGVSAIKLTVPSHDKTTADLLSVWTDGTWEYVLCKIESPTVLIVMSKPKLIGAELQIKIVNTLTTTLSNVSGAVNTSDITNITGSDSPQYPSIKDINTRLVIDDVVITEPGTYTGNKVQVLDNHNVIDPTKLVFANPMVWNDADTFAKVAIVYNFYANGIMQMDYSVDIQIDHFIRNIGFIQVQPMDTAVYPNLLAYMNGLKVIGTEDFKSGVSLSSPTASLFIKSANLLDIAKPPSRMTQILYDSSANPKIGRGFGYNNQFGSLTDAERLNNDSYCYINGGTNKIYLFGFAGQMTNKNIIYGTAYCGYFDPNKNGLRADYYFHQDDHVKYYVIETSGIEDKKVVSIPAELAGKKIEIIEQSSGITLHTPDYIQSQGIIISATGAGEYMKLKLS